MTSCSLTAWNSAIFCPIGLYTLTVSKFSPQIVTVLLAGLGNIPKVWLSTISKPVSSQS